MELGHIGQMWTRSPLHSYARGADNPSVMVGRVVVVVVSGAAAACASSGAVPRPFPVPGGNPPAVTAPAGDAPRDTPSRPVPHAALVLDGSSVSTMALSLRGVPYRDGGVDPDGFDCSGLVQYVFGQHGVALPREARQQFGVGRGVAPHALEPGDLVFFTTIAPGASHVGIAIGGDQFVHAPSTRGVVRVDTLSSEYWANRYVGARRVG
jgi:cell wall-associated NlpC family hydrolase